MKKARWVPALMLAAVAASAVLGWSQAETKSIQTTTTWGGKLDEASFVDLATRYELVCGRGWQLSVTWSELLQATYYGLVAPDIGSQAAHVQEILILLEGPEGADIDPSAEIDLDWDQYAGHLLGDGGRLSAFITALQSYVDRLETYADLLVAFYAEKCVEENGLAGCSAASGQSTLDRQINNLGFLKDRMRALAQLACDTACQIDPEADPDAANSEILAVYACAATAAGYWPTLAEYAPFPWQSAMLPSTLQDLLALLERMHLDLTDAMNRARNY